MIFQSAMSASLAETVFRSARNSVTKTTTNTATALPIKGVPVRLSTASADGTWIAQCLTETSVINNLFVGVAYDYPELHTNTAARWGGESHGLVQCYGYASYAQVHVATDTVDGAGLYLIPGINEFFTCDGNLVTATAGTSTASHGLVPGLGGLAVLMGTVDSATATTVAAAKVFIRAM